MNAEHGTLQWFLVEAVLAADAGGWVPDTRTDLPEGRSVTGWGPTAENGLVGGGLVNGKRNCEHEDCEREEPTKI